MRKQSLGTHVIIDLYMSPNNQVLTDLDWLVSTLRVAALHGGATIIGDKSHKFGEGMGGTAIILLAESHISVHTWPENNFAAIDIFMCGNTDPHASKKFIVDAFKPLDHSFVIFERGTK
jgi:S-adenosylmethionine decarboxylase